MPKLGRLPTQKEISIAKPLIVDHIAEHFSNPLKAFQYVDQNNSGKIGVNELEHTMQMWNLPIPHEVLAAIMMEADTDKNGELDYGEFCAKLVRDTVQLASPRGKKSPMKKTNSRSMPEVA